MDELLAEVRTGRSRTPLAKMRYRESTVSTWPGDPARAAKIITDIVPLDEPRLRLLLGNGAVESARQAPQARAAKTEKWVNMSRSADFPASR